MTRDEEIIVNSENRDLFEAWMAGEVMLQEAVFIARRGDFYCRLLEFRLPEFWIKISLKVYDALFESRSLLPR